MSIIDLLLERIRNENPGRQRTSYILQSTIGCTGGLGRMFGLCHVGCTEERADGWFYERTNELADYDGYKHERTNIRTDLDGLQITSGANSSASYLLTIRIAVILNTGIHRALCIFTCERGR